MYVGMSRFKPGTYDINGVPFAALPNQDKQEVVWKSSNIPNFHGDKATDDQNTAVVTRAPNQSTQQGYPALYGMNNAMNSTETRNSGMLNSNIEVAGTDGRNTNVADTSNTEHDWDWGKLSRGTRNSRKRYRKLKERGIPEGEAQKLCSLPWSTIEEMLSKCPQKRLHSEEPQGPVNKKLKMPGTDQQNIDIPFRVGISNSKPMSEDPVSVAQNRAGMIKTPNQSTPQTISKKAMSMRMNNGINSTEARNSEMLKSKKVTKAGGINTNVAGVILTVSNNQLKKKIKGCTRKRFERLLKVGIPHEEARSLCRLPWIVLEKMLLNNPHKIWYNNSGDPQGSVRKYLKMSAEIEEQNCHVGPGREVSNTPNFHGDKATVAQNIAGVTRAPNQSTKTFPQEGLRGMNNGMNSVARNSGMLNSNMGVARTDGIKTNVADTTNTEHDWWKKLSKASRKRYRKLKERGIPDNEAQQCCTLPWSTIEEKLLKYPWNRNNPEPQGPANKNLMPGTDEQNFDIPFRVGITNSKPMSEDQMKMLHQHLILAIKEQCSDGEGPTFLGFSHKAGWVLVTCANQRSKDWLVHEAPYLEPWPTAMLSIIPEEELPKPPTAVTLIPEAEAATVEEAMSLLKVQNEGLNTDLWKVRFEKVENGVRKISFTLDDPSADVLRAQNCQAAISFTMVNFKIKGQYRPYPPERTPSQVLGSSKQCSQSLGGKSSGQATSKAGPSPAAKGRQLPQATGRLVQPIIQDPEPSAKNTLFTQGSGGITREPEALAVGRSVPKTRIECGAPPIMKNSQGHGTFAQKDQERPVTSDLLNSARGLISQAARCMDMSILPIHDSMIGTPFTQGSGSADGIVFGSDGSVLATRGRPSQRTDSSSYVGASVCHGSLSQSREDLNATSQADFPAITYPPSVALSGTSILNGRGAATEASNDFLGPSQAWSGFEAQPFVRDSQFGTNFDQRHREVITASDYDSVPTNQVPSQVEVPCMQNPQSANEAFDQSNVVDLTVTDNEPSDRELSPEAEGGYHTWVIEDLESYGRQFTQNIPETGTLNSVTGPSLASYRDQSFTEFAHGSTGIPPNLITLDKDLPPQPRGASGASISGSESHGEFQDGRLVYEQESRRRGLLPRLSGGLECIELDNHGRQDNRGIDLEPMPDRVRHEARGFEASVQKPERTFRDRGILTDEESRRRWPHPSVFRSRSIESGSHGRSSQDSRGTVTDRESRTHEVLPYPSGDFETRPIDSESRGISFHGHRTVADRESRSNRGLSPQGSCYPDGRTGRKSRSDRHSPQARCSYDEWTIEEPGSCGSRTTDWNGSTVDREDSLSRRKSRGLIVREERTMEQRAPW